MLVAGVDWTNVLVALIAGLPAIIAAVLAGLIHGQVKTPSGKTIGQVTEYAHDTAIANNLLLRAANGETRSPQPGELKTAGEAPPQVPDEGQK